MKINNIIKFVTTSMVILFVNGTATATGRVKVFEMAESGLTFEFPVSATETEVVDSVIAGSAIENEDIGI